MINLVMNLYYDQLTMSQFKSKEVVGLFMHDLQHL